MEPFDAMPQGGLSLLCGAQALLFHHSQAPVFIALVGLSAGSSLPGALPSYLEDFCASEKDLFV